MSQEVFTRDDSAKALTPIDVPLTEILSDGAFNCRGVLSPFDVRELADSIREQGLQNPIQITPYNFPPHKFKILAGHRRFAAYKMVQLQFPESERKLTIPAVIKYGMSEIDALAYNLLENIKRKDLNILQEAKALEKFKFAGYSEGDTSKLLGMSRGWVQIRFMLLELPDEIQAEAAAGVLNNVDIRTLVALTSVEQQFDMIRKLKDKTLLGKKKTVKVRQEEDLSKRTTSRLRAEINAVQMLIFDTIGPSFATKMLAWAQGEIDTRTMYYHVRAEAESQGKFFTIPLEYR